MLSSNLFADTIKYPTSLIVRGAEPIGIELAKSLLDQGGFVIMADSTDREGLTVIKELKKYKLFRYIDLSEIVELESPLRRLDYVFYLSHSFEEITSEISSKDFLDYSKFLDEVLTLSQKFNAKFLASTSIRAHQYNVANKLLDIDSLVENKIYTAAEIQRYTESLVVEYLQKESLDVRIVRLGELLGDGIEYSPNTTLGRLIKEGLKDNEIVIYGDGLESEYYVHLQDAIYGLIKAQFSKNTSGETFSLSYEYEVSALSIAYKINDFLTEPKEIKFSSQNTNDFGLKLYKPAPNLMRIGWKPRISFERALKQTYEYAKKYFEFESLELRLKKDKVKSNVITDIFFEKTEQKSSEDEIQEYGALGRLIAERKLRDKDRHGSIVLANEHLAKRIKKESSATGYDRLIGSIRKGFDNFAKNYRWIKNLSIRQFIGYSIGFVVLLYLYINVFSVVLSFGRNLLIFYSSANEITASIEQNNRTGILSNIDNANKNLKLANLKVDSFYFLEGWGVYSNFSDRFGGTTESIISTLDSLKQVINSSNMVFDFVSSYDPQIVYRPNSQSLLSVQNNVYINQSYDEVEFSNFKLNEALKLLDKNMEIFTDFPYEYFGLKSTVVENGLNSFKDALEKLKSQYSNYLKISRVIEYLLKVGKPQTYVFILTDNGFYLPSGGNPVGLITLEIDRGGIESIKISTMVNNDYKIEPLDEYALSQINLISEQSITNDNLTMSDLLLVGNGNFYLNTLARDFSIKEGKRIDGVFVLNLDLLIDILNVVGASEYNNVKFDSSSIIANLNMLSNENENPILYRREIITNIYAVSIRDLLNNLSSKYSEIVRLIENGVENKSIVFKVFDNSNISAGGDDLVSKVGDYISINVVSDFELAETRSLPQYTIKVNTLIKDDLSTRKTINIELTDVTNLNYTVVCMPVGSSNFTFNEIADNNKFIRFGEEQTCIRFTNSVGDSIQLSYDSIPIRNIFNSSLRYELGIRKQPGAIVNLESLFTTENLLFKQSSDTASEEKIEQVEYKATMKGDKIISYDLINNNQ